MIAQTRSQRCFDVIVDNNTQVLLLLPFEHKTLTKHAVDIDAWKALISSFPIYSWWFWASLWVKDVIAEIGKLQEPCIRFHPTTLLGHRHRHYWVHLYGYFYWPSCFRSTSACHWKVAFGHWCECIITLPQHQRKLKVARCGDEVGLQWG